MSVVPQNHTQPSKQAHNVSVLAASPGPEAQHSKVQTAGCKEALCTRGMNAQLHTRGVNAQLHVSGH